MKEEIKALEKNNTCELTTIPGEKNCVGCKWVFKTKLKSDGSLEMYKARLVAKGYDQELGLDFFDTFSPIIKLTSFRILLAVAAVKNWYINHLDVNNAFLHGDLNEEVYMNPPPGYLDNNDNRVCRLKKCLYGLKQASRQWFQQLTGCLLNFGYTQSKNDQSLFTKTNASSFTALLVYVDDIVLSGNDLIDIQAVKDHLHKAFTIKDLGELKYILGIEVSRILRCIKNTPGEGLFYSSNSDLHLKGYTYSNWAGCTDIRRSVTGYGFYIGDSLVSWRSKKQQVVSRSSTEAEYRSAANSLCETLWILFILRDLKVQHQQPAVIYIDSQSAYHLAHNPVQHQRTKHIELDCHLIRDKIKEGVVKLLKISNDIQVADIYTKPLSNPLFERFKGKMNMKKIYIHLQGGCKDLSVK